MIRADSLTFEEAALRFSDDPYSRQNGGIVTNHELLEPVSYTHLDVYKRQVSRSSESPPVSCSSSESCGSSAPPSESSLSSVLSTCLLYTSRCV